MELKLTKVDPHTCSIEELDAEIERLSELKDEYYNLEQSIKIFINSIYGGVGSPWFECYNVALAEAVTIQGQDMIKYANDILDEYFLNEWHLDTELHKKLGLSYVNKLIGDTVIIYNDTDSTYMTFENVLETCDWSGDPVDFILKMKEYRLDGYISNKFEEYAAKFNTKNLQDLELEKISYSGLMVAKKKYILDLAWKDPGVFYKPQEKIKPTGVEVVQGSTPPFARKTLKQLLHTLFVNGKDLQYKDIVKHLKTYKQDFILQNPDDISKTQAIGDYEKYVLEDRKEIRLAPKAQMNVKSAAIYNHKLLNTKWKTKYNLINTGDKLKFYYAKNDEKAFGFLPGNFPYEIAPEVDYDMQFQKVIVEPFNRFMIAAGFNPVPGNLIYAKALF